MLFNPSMKIAVPTWRNRVAPVFDVAGRLVLVEVADGEEVGRCEETLGSLGLERRAARLVELGVDTLICGAVSQPLEVLLAGSGIQVLARVCGDVEEILQAFRAGTLEEERYAMPGCCGRRRQRSRGRRVRRGGWSNP